MAKMSMDLDASDILGGLIKFENSDDVALKMVDEAEDILKENIEKGAKKHIVTGKMAASVYKTKPVVNKDGDIVGRIKFDGSDGVQVSKSGNKFDRTNWIKAFRIEHGTSKQKAEPFVRPAVRKSKKAIAAKMKEVFEREVKP